MKNLPTLCHDSLFAVQFSNSVSKTRAILLFTINIIEMFELHASMPPMQSAEFQATIPQKFPIIIVVTSLDGIYGWSIQTLLRGENDLKQSDKNSGNQ